MTRKLGASLVLGALLFAPFATADAQQPKKVWQIGFLAAGSAQTAHSRIEAFRQGLRAFGYVEGKDIVIEYRNAAGKVDQVPRNAVELVRLKVDIVVTAGPTDTRAAKEATSTIPIVMTQDPDPVGNGFVASLARPGGNITGLSRIAPELSGKQLELLKETSSPGGQKLNEPGNAQSSREIELAAGALGVKLQYLDILASKDVETAFEAARTGRADAVLILASPILSQRQQIADRALTSRIPAIYDRREFVDAGGLMSYGVNISDLDRRAATYVDRILKGAKPADLPVEQPTKFELIINLKTAKQIGVTIPQWVLVKADRVIK